MADKLENEEILLQEELDKLDCQETACDEEKSCLQFTVNELLKQKAIAEEKLRIQQERQKVILERLKIEQKIELDLGKLDGDQSTWSQQVKAEKRGIEVQEKRIKTSLRV